MLQANGKLDVVSKDFHSYQSFKILYAMKLCDYGHLQRAQLYNDSLKTKKISEYARAELEILDDLLIGGKPMVYEQQPQQIAQPQEVLKPQVMAPSLPQQQTVPHVMVPQQQQSPQQPSQQQVQQPVQQPVQQFNPQQYKLQKEEEMRQEQQLQQQQQQHVDKRHKKQKRRVVVGFLQCLLVLYMVVEAKILKVVATAMQ